MNDDLRTRSRRRRIAAAVAMVFVLALGVIGGLLTTGDDSAAIERARDGGDDTATPASPDERAHRIDERDRERDRTRDGSPARDGERDRDDGSTPSTSPNEDEPPASAIDDVRIGRSAEIGRRVVTVMSAERQGDALVIEVEVRNVGRRQRAYGPEQWSIEDEAGKALATGAVGAGTLGQGVLAEGEAATGTISFALPRGSYGVVFQASPGARSARWPVEA